MKKPQKVYFEAYLLSGRMLQDADDIKAIVERFTQDGLNNIDLEFNVIAGDRQVGGAIVSAHKKDCGAWLTLMGRNGPAQMVGLKSFAQRCRTGKQIVSQ